MTQFPHDYVVTASAIVDGSVDTRSEGKPSLAVAPPKTFGGTGDIWSPEELLLAALADCFILTFRAIASSAGLAWQHIDCRATGVLDRDGSTILFTAFDLHCELEIEVRSSEREAMSVLGRAKRSCFVSRALAVHPTLHTTIIAVSGGKV